MSLDHTTFYAAGIIEALSYMHGQDIAFRDLKPDNVVIGGDGTLQLQLVGVCTGIPPCYC